MTAFLPKGYRLAFRDHPGEYVITDVLGRGASTIAYTAEYYDEAGCQSSRIIKEFCPLNITLDRESDGALICKDSEYDRFLRGKESFIAGGQNQTELRNRVLLQNETPFLAGVYSANNTVYLEVAPFYGKTLNDLPDLSLLQRMQLCLAVAKLVERYHAEGYLCLDIKPSNIFVLQNSADEIVTELIEYIDFDSVRRKESVTFGNSLSFTEEWAAPEQKTPYGYKKICEATDVYAIGELAFWLLFGRHSLPRERRDSSQYPYEECKTNGEVFQRYAVRMLIQQILHKSIRSSIVNRFSTISEMISPLQKLVEELAKKQAIIVAPIQTKPYFFGREAELAEINAKLTTDRIVFVTGIHGIGKSELVKQYIRLHQKDYTNILWWTYDGDLDSMVSWGNTVKITNFNRLSEETDSQFAKRKLERLSELIHDQKNLIFIDNLDKLVEEINGQETLKLLLALPGKLLIATRAAETLYSSVRVEAVSEASELLNLFSQFCPYKQEEQAAVSEIIELLGHHTLLVELLAHYSVHRGPEKTLQHLRDQGITGLTSEKVRLYKDDSVLSLSVSRHIEKLFSMDALTDNQVLTMAKLALLPSVGVPTRKFAAFYSIDNFSDINWLIQHGWMTSVRSEYETILLHPTVASVMMDHLKNNSELLTQLYVDCYNAIRIHKPTEMEWADEVLYGNAIALATMERYRITDRQAGIFISQYVALHTAYGNPKAMLQYIDFAIVLLEKYHEQGKYCALVERGYRQKVSELVKLNRYEDAISIAQMHLPVALKAKDLYTIADWYYYLSYVYGVYQTKSSSWFTLKYYFLGLYYTMKLEADARRKSHRFFDTEHLVNQLGYDYMEKAKYKFISNLYLGFANWMENQDAAELFCSKGNKSGINTLKRAYDIREKVNNDPRTKSIYNGFEIIIDKARIAFLEQKYHDAECLLNEIIQYADENHLLPTSTLYRVHQFLGQIALRKSPVDRETAIAEFEICLKIAEEMENHNTYAVRLELGFQYLMAGDLTRAKPIVMDLWQETRLLAPEVRKTYRADALRNMSFLHLSQGSGFTANNMMKLAMEEYDAAESPYSLKQFGRARAYVLRSDIVLRHGKGSADERKQMAIDRLEMANSLFEETVGLYHPESADCQERLKHLKS